MSKRIKYIILETTNLLSPYWLHSQGDNGFGYIDSHRFCAKTDHLIKWKNRKAKFEQLWTCVKKFNLFLFKVHKRKKLILQHSKLNMLKTNLTKFNLV